VPATSPEAVLDLLQDQRERVVVGTTAAGQVRELVLRQRVRFRLRTPAGKELIPEIEVLQEREMSFTETQVLGKEAEEALLYRDMQNAVVRQIMARLAAVKAL
jgi:LPS-assembly lipoprotein